MSKKDLLLFATGTGWSVLGFKRGLDSYDYQVIRKEPYLYIHKAQYGFAGLFLYINPFLLPLSLYKEMYRLEVNLRGLEQEKKTDYYNHLF